MNMRKLMLGNPRGRTAWQMLKDKWQKEKAAERYATTFAKAYNPLSLKPGDLVELGFVDSRSLTVETVLWYQTAAGEPDIARYGLKDLESGALSLLEAVAGGPDDELVHSLFEFIDEMELDPQLLDVLEHEDSLRHTVEGEGGHPVELDYDKDFVTDATLTVFQATESTTFLVTTFNYCHGTDEGESYLTVEVIADSAWMNFYLGQRLAQTDVAAMGTVSPQQAS
jgi:hypothetical protein